MPAAFAASAQGPPDLREAARLDREGKCAESEPLYQRALSAGSPSAALLNNVGNHYLACGQPAKAREYFERLVRRNPSHPNANLQLARLAVEQKQSAEAVRYLRLLASLGDPGLLAEAGALSARIGEFKLAQQVFQRVVVARPGDFDALWNLGRAAARAGDLPRAAETLEAALRFKPEDPGVLLELGTAYAAGGDYPRAVFLLAQALSKAPEHPGIALALARAAEDAGYYGDSAIAYDRYLRLRPSDETARRDRARVLANTLGRRDEGLKALEEYVARQPRDPVGHFQLAQLCWKTDAEKSLAHLAEAVRLDPRLAPAHTARAWLLHRLGRDSEAVRHLEMALKLTPEDVRVLDQYGLVLTALDRVAEAEKAFQKAAGLASGDWEVRLHLGRALMEQGRETEARVWLEQYQKLRPARQRDPRREPGMIELATLSENERRAREIGRFRSMAGARPDDVQLRLQLGVLLLADGRDADAEREFRSLLEMNADEKTLAQAGRALLDAGRYAAALPLLEKGSAWLDHAIALFHTSGAGEALGALEKIPAGEQSGEFLLLKARILDHAGWTEEAQGLLAESTAWDGARPQLVEQAALLLANYGRFGDAARMLDRAISAAPDNRGLLLSESVVLALAGRLAEAEQRLKKLEGRWPEWNRPYRVHALVLAAAKRTQESVQKLRTAAVLGSANTAGRCQTLRDWLLPTCREAVP